MTINLIEEIEDARQTASPQTQQTSRVRLRVGDIISHPRHGVGAVYETNWRTTSVAFCSASDAEFDTRELSKIVLVLDKKLEHPRNFDNENWRQPLAETNLSYWEGTLAWGLGIGRYPQDHHPRFLADLKLKSAELQMVSRWNYPEGHPVWNSAEARKSTETFYNSNNYVGKETKKVLASRLQPTPRGGYITELIPKEITTLPDGKTLQLFYEARISPLQLNLPRFTKSQNIVCHHGIAPDSRCSLCLGTSPLVKAVKRVKRRSGSEPMREIICRCDAIPKCTCEICHRWNGQRSEDLSPVQRPFCEYHRQLKRNRNGEKVRDEAGKCVIDERTGLIKKEFSRIIAVADGRRERLAAIKNREERDRATFAYEVQHTVQGDGRDYFGGKSASAYQYGNSKIWKPYPTRTLPDGRVELRCSKPPGNKDAPKSKKWWPILEPAYQKRDPNNFTYEFCLPSQMANPFQEYQFIHLDPSSSLGNSSVSVNAGSQRSQYNSRQLETNLLRKIVLTLLEVDALRAWTIYKKEREGEAGLSRSEVILRRKREIEPFIHIISGTSIFEYPNKYAHKTDKFGDLKETDKGYLRCPHGWLVIGQTDSKLRWTFYCTICAPVRICHHHGNSGIGLKNKTLVSLSRGWYRVINNPRNSQCLPVGTAREDLFGPSNPTACDLGRLPSASEIQHWNSKLIREKLPELFESNLYPQRGLHGWR